MSAMNGQKYKNSLKEVIEKRTVKWQPEHFPKGTEVIVKLDMGSDTNPKTLVVDHIYESYPGNFIVVGVGEVMVNGGAVQPSYHISHVVGIGKRGTGPMVIKKTIPYFDHKPPSRTPAWVSRSHALINNKTSYVEQQIRSLGDAPVGFDVAAIVNELEKAGLFKDVPPRYMKASKKKIKRHLRRLLPHHRRTHAKVNEIEELFWCSIFTADEELEQCDCTDDLDNNLLY